MHSIVKTSLIALLSSSIASASGPEVSRRGFLRLLGAGAAAAAAPSLPGLAAATQAPIRIREAEYLNGFRKALINRRLLNGGGPRPPFGLAHESIWNYERELTRALNGNNLSSNERALLERYRLELRASYPNTHYKPSENSNSLKEQNASSQETDVYEIEILPDLIRVRFILSSTLITRIAWQLAYPEEDILSRNSNDKDFLLIKEYREELIKYAEAFEDGTIRMPKESQFFLDHWLEDINKAFEVIHVRERSERVDAELTTSKFCRGLL